MLIGKKGIEETDKQFFVEFGARQALEPEIGMRIYISFSF